MVLPLAIAASSKSGRPTHFSWSVRCTPASEEGTAWIAATVVIRSRLQGSWCMICGPARETRKWGCTVGISHLNCKLHPLWWHPLLLYARTDIFCLWAPWDRHFCMQKHPQDRQILLAKPGPLGQQANDYIVTTSGHTNFHFLSSYDWQCFGALIPLWQITKKSSRVGGRREWGLLLLIHVNVINGSGALMVGHYSVLPTEL